MKFYIFFACICMFSTLTLFSQEEKSARTQNPNSKPTESKPKINNRDEKSDVITVNTDLQKNSRGLGYGLIVGGATAASFGVVLETSAILAYFLLDEQTRVKVSSDSHVFTFLHIASATFITAGVASIISGSTYIDDSVYGKKYWKKTQVITGSVLTSVGAAATIAGSVLYAAVDMKDIGSGIIGSGVSLMSSGIVSLFIGLFAR